MIAAAAKSSAVTYPVDVRDKSQKEPHQKRNENSDGKSVKTHGQAGKGAGHLAHLQRPRGTDSVTGRTHGDPACRPAVGVDNLEAMPGSGLSGQQG